MKSSARILDRNLDALLRRAYRPVQPRPEFVARLEAELAPWLDARHEPRPLDRRPGTGSSSRSRFWAAGLVAAAAALLLLLRFFPGTSPSEEPSRSLVAATAFELTERGDVALRRGGEGPWRAATPEELLEGVEHVAGALELATPDSKAIRLRGAESWEVRLATASRLDLEPLHAAQRLVLHAGSADFVGGGQELERNAPCALLWREGAFLDADLEWTPAGSGAREALVVELPEDGASEETPEPGDTATLLGQVNLASTTEAAEGAVAERFTVSLLREVPLPQVSFPESRGIEGATGGFEWAGLRPGTYEVFVSAPGRAIWKSGRLELSAGEAHELVVELVQGVTLRGFVVDAETGAAVEGALVLSEGELPTHLLSLDAREFPSAARALTHTGRDGDFLLEHLNPGPHRLRANGADHGPAWQELEVATGGAEGVVFQLARGGAVEGRCEHADGRPFEGAQVIASHFSGGSPSGSMTYRGMSTDADGGYRLEHLAPGMYVVLFYDENAQDGSFQPRYSPVTIVEGETARVDFLGETRGGSITGQVVDAGGDPLPFANLHAWDYNDGDPRWYGETADEAGRFEFIGLEPGGYDLYAGTSSSTVRSAHVDVEWNTRAELHIVLEGQALEVRVVDSESLEPLGYVDLSLVKREEASASGTYDQDAVAARVFTESDGVLRLEHLKPGLYDLLALPEVDGYALGLVRDVWIDADAGDESVVLHLERSCPVDLLVVDEGGRPIDKARVDLDSPRGIRWMSPWTPLSDAEGRLSLDRLYAGRWRVRVHHPDHGAVEIELDVHPGPSEVRRVVLPRR